MHRRRLRDCPRVKGSRPAWRAWRASREEGSHPELQLRGGDCRRGADGVLPLTHIAPLAPPGRARAGQPAAPQRPRGTARPRGHWPRAGGAILLPVPGWPRPRAPSRSTGSCWRLAGAGLEPGWNRAGAGLEPGLSRAGATGCGRPRPLPGRVRRALYYHGYILIGRFMLRG